MSSKEELQLQFAKLAEKIGSNSVFPISQLSTMKKIMNLNDDRVYFVIKKKLKLIFSCVVMLISGLMFYYDLHSAKGLAKFWLNWKQRDIYNEQCLIDMPNVAQDIFRPPVDCSMCENVKKIDKVSVISPQEFQQKYAYSGHPVVITDAMVNWTVKETFTFHYLKQLYGDDSPALENYRQSCQFFPYQTEFRSLREVFSMSDERAQLKDGSKPWYIGWSNCDSSVANVLRKSYGRPYFLPEDSESSKTDWIFMGSPGYGAHMHIDHVGNPSWQAQIFGYKKWILLPPPECYYQCQPLETLVEPGEIIVLDTNSWFHRTLIVGDEISITIGSEFD